jgi:hypothetical protein
LCYHHQKADAANHFSCAINIVQKRLRREFWASLRSLPRRASLERKPTRRHIIVGTPSVAFFKRPALYIVNLV